MWVAQTNRLICHQKCRILQHSQKCSFTDIPIFRPPRIIKPMIRIGLGHPQAQSCYRFSRYYLPYQISPQSRPSTPSLFDPVQYGTNSMDRKKFSTEFWIIGKPLSKVIAAITGRRLNKWYARLDPGTREVIWQYLWQNRFIIHGLWSAVVFGWLAYYLTHLQIAPITGRKRFISYSEAQMQEIVGFQTNVLLNAFRHKMYPDDHPSVQRVVGVTNKLVSKNAEIQRIPIQKWVIHVIKDPIVNAFVLPSGHIFVFEGLLNLLKTDDQLAIILGHEMAHAVLNHGVETMSLSDFEDFIIVVGLLYIWCAMSSIFLAFAVSGLLFLAVDVFTFMPHSRRVEWEADFVGLVFAANACYDIRQAGALWRKIDDHQHDTNPGLAFLPQWMLTHPDSRKRADYFDSLKVEAEKWREEKGCPKLPPEVIG